MDLKVFEIGFNYSQDGPGNRMVIHLSGCNMKCPWCSNPEGMSTLNKSESISVENLAKKIISAKPMFFDGGGVTFTGGECSLQTPALLKLIDIIKKEGVSVALESNASTKDFLKLAKVADYVITDYKHPSKEKLKEFTDGNLEIIEENLISLIKLKPLHIRIPLIGGFNNDTQAFEGFLEFFQKLKSVSENFDVEILKYHEYGKEKWLKLGLNYAMKDAFVKNEDFLALKKLFESSGIKIIKT